MREAMEQGRLTSHQLVEMYLARIGMYQQTLKAAVYVNPNALQEADRRDRERAAGKVRGPLHGIPIAAQGQHSHDQHAAPPGGALAFDGLVPPYEATLTKNLREAGAVIIAKTDADRARQLRRRRPTRAGQLQRRGRATAINPYDPRRDPRRGTPRTAGRSSTPAARAQVSARPPNCGPPTSARKRRARSWPVQSEHARRASSRPSAASAAMA